MRSWQIFLEKVDEKIQSTIMANNLPAKLAVASGLSAPGTTALSCRIQKTGETSGKSTGIRGEWIHPEDPPTCPHSDLMPSMNQDGTANAQNASSHFRAAERSKDRPLGSWERRTIFRVIIRPS